MKRTSLMLIAAIFATHGTLWADVRIKSNFNMTGIVGLMNSEGSTEVMISGEKGKTVSTVKMTNKVMKFLGAGKPQESAEITRIDKEVFWNLNLKDKKYTEKTFAEARAEIEKALEDARKEKEKAAKKHPEDSVRFTTTIDVKKTGKSQTVAGHEAEQYLIKMKCFGKSAEGGSGTFKVLIDTWMATGIGEAEHVAYYKKLAEKMSVSGQSQQSLEGALVALGIDPTELAEKLHEMKGIALLTIMTVSAEGENEGGSSGGADLLNFKIEAIEVATKPIAASEFEVPEGFKIKK